MAPWPVPAAGRHLDRSGIGVDAGVDQAVGDAQRLLAGVDHLDRTHDDAAERVGARGAQAGGARRGGGSGQEFLAGQAVAGERADEVVASREEPSVLRRRVRHLELLDVARELVDRDVEAAIGHDPIAEHRVVVTVVERDELVVGVEFGEVEAGDPLAHVDRQLQRSGEPGPERPQRLAASAGGRSRPPAR